MNIKFKIAKLMNKFGKKSMLIKCYKSMGVKIGENCNICCSFNSTEPYLIEIGDNSVISYNVSFITHDASLGTILNRKYIDLYGKIIIGKNCFIGAGSIILYGVKLGDKTIVAAGSVVSKSFPDGNVVIAGNPAKIICSVDDYLKKKENLLIDTNGCTYEEKKNLILSSKLCEK